MTDFILFFQMNYSPLLFHFAKPAEITLNEPQYVRFAIERLVIDHPVRQIPGGTIPLQRALRDIEPFAQIVIIQQSVAVGQNGEVRFCGSRNTRPDEFYFQSS